MVCGMPKLEFLQANVATARAYAAPLPPAEMERLRELLAGRKVVLEDIFAHHRDGFTPEGLRSLPLSQGCALPGAAPRALVRPMAVAVSSRA